MTKEISVDTSKLLGFDKKGTALFDTIDREAGSQTKATGEGSKLVGSAKMTGQVGK